MTMTEDSPAARLHTPEASEHRKRAYAKRLVARRRRVIFAIRGMAHGFSDKEIGEMLEVTQSGFTNMIYREMRQCEVKNRVQLVFHYIKHGIITGDDIRRVPTHGEGSQL